MKNANRPASPCRTSENTGAPHYKDVPHSGLTKRENFAAMAPDAIPDWFIFHADLSAIIKPALTDHQINMMNEYRDENYGLSDDDFKIGADSHSEMRIHEGELSTESAKQRYFAWKIYHADELLKGLEK